MLLSVTPRSAAQNVRNVAYVEIGGTAIVPSINYERRVRERMRLRGGLSFVTGETEGESETDTTFIVPLSASLVTHPASNHHFEIGGGVTIAGGDRQDLWGVDDEDDTFSTAFLSGIAGYRYERPAGGFVFRAVFTPVVGDGEVLPWAGISFGYGW